MQEKRHYKRFRIDLLELSGKMSLASKMEIIDISIGGVALKADRRLNIDKEYVIKLGDSKRATDLKGVVVRSELTGFEQGYKGEQVAVYTAAMIFNAGQEAKIRDVLTMLKQYKKEDVPVALDLRLNVRFLITTPTDNTLNFPAQFKVKEISLSGMRILTDHPLDIESKTPMALSLHDDASVSFMGRIASCIAIEESGHPLYDIGVEFKDLVEKDRALLNEFIGYLATLEIPSS
jgi:hypothetical protein